MDSCRNEFLAVWNNAYTMRLTAHESIALLALKHAWDNNPTSIVELSALTLLHTVLHGWYDQDITGVLWKRYIDAVMKYRLALKASKHDYTAERPFSPF